MDRIIAANSVNLAGADGPPASGTPQYATDGNPALNIPATRWPAYQYNAIQEEIMNVLIAAGIAPDKANNAQLLAAITGAKLGRIKLSANTTFYVNPATGNDANSGLVVGSPWQTMQHAVNILFQNYDFNGFVVTVQGATNSTYTESIQVNGNQAGLTLPGNFILDFGGGTSLLTNAANDCLDARYNGMCTVQNVRITNTGGFNGLVASDRGFVQIGAGVNFGTVGASHMACQVGGRISNTSNYTVSGNAASHLFAGLNGVIIVASQVTLTGTPAFSAGYAQANDNGTIRAFGQTFVGSATGSRYAASFNGVIDTNSGGPTFFPGNAAGTTANGGQYG